MKSVGAGYEGGLRGADTFLRSRTQGHCWIANIGGQLRGLLFAAWQGMPIKRRGTTRRPIPDNWNSIGHRSSLFHLAGNRNAAHPVNAMLNYAYTVLESEVRISAIAEG
jgi:CRISP-associated protein Cas1